jgi:hypothetical protein
MTTDLALPAITMCAGSYTTNRDTIPLNAALLFTHSLNMVR